MANILSKNQLFYKTVNIKSMVRMIAYVRQCKSSSLVLLKSRQMVTCVRTLCPNVNFPSTLRVVKRDISGPLHQKTHKPTPLIPHTQSILSPNTSRVTSNTSTNRQNVRSNSSHHCSLPRAILSPDRSHLGRRSTAARRTGND